MTTSSERSGPIRTCVGCRTRRPQDELHRCVLVGGVARVDRRAPGRGAWVCGAECLELARRRGAFRRAWRRDVPAGAIDALARDLTTRTERRTSGWGSSRPVRD